MSEARLQNPIFPKHYSITRNRTYDSGLLSIPVAGPAGTPEEIVRVHGGSSRLEVGFAGDQLGGPPKIPSPDLNDGNSVLLAGAQMAALPMEQHQGEHAWDISGGYLYACKAQIGLDADIPTGVLPIDSGYPSQNTIPAAVVMSPNIVQGDQNTQKKVPAPYYPKL